MTKVTWTELKSYANSKGLSVQYINTTNFYKVWVIDGRFELYASVVKDGGSDHLDFETNYKPTGNLPLDYSRFEYVVPVSIRQSANTAANATVWAMRVDPGASKSVFIERIYLSASFDAGTPIGRALLRYSIGGFGSATPTGGTSLSVISLDSANPASVVTDARLLDTGLTTSGVNFQSPAFGVGVPACDGSVVPFDFTGAIRLQPGQGLYIRLFTAAVIGLGLNGYVQWKERSII
jgi:hypothetical protein